MKNTILFCRRTKIMVEKGSHQLSSVYIATALKNLESFGYTFSPALLEAVSTLSEEDFIRLYKDLLTHIKERVGAHVEHRPMYPNFPAQVMEASDAELYLNAIRHYLGSFVRDVTGIDVTKESLPVYEKEERFPLLDATELKVIDVGTEGEVEELITQLLSSKTSISGVDKKDVEWALLHLDLSKILPPVIPMKESVALVVSVLLKKERVPLEHLRPYVKTATDVLRVAVALSGGDVSLGAPCRFKKFTRGERRVLLGLLESLKEREEDMLRYKERWIRLGEILHPGDYAKQYPKAYEAFDVLRSNKPFPTFNGEVERLLLLRDIPKVVALLKKRPGEFARRLDHLLRISGGDGGVLQAFSEVAEKVSTPVLLQVSSHFQHRHHEKEHRVFFPKGNVSKVTAIPHHVDPIAESLAKEVVTLCEEALMERFRSLPPLGNVWIEERLSNYHVPFSQRSASKSLRTLTRGSVLDLPEGDTIRLFAHWRDIQKEDGWHNRVDIDLSCVMFDEHWKYQAHISYTNLRERTLGAHHSGDITSAPDGASEFLDFHLPTLVKNGIRYVTVSLHSFNGQHFLDIPECFCGWMVRKAPKSGEIFEPKTVQDKLDLTSKAQISLPVILDVVEKKIIWTDLALTRDITSYNNVEGHLSQMSMVGLAMTSLAKPNLYELFSLHAKARGTIVEEKETADVVYSVQEGVTPFHLEEIVAEYL